MKKIITFLAISFLAYVNLFSQCFPDRHNTNWFDEWISCETSTNPNPIRGESHWILYNFNHTYELGEMHVWNTNAEEYLVDGMKDVVIDVSNDGVNWTEVGQFQFEMASGISTYEGFDGPDLAGFEARYLLITALSNWGGDCFGLSEIRIDIISIINSPVSIEEQDKNGCLSVKISPNPVRSYSKAIISSRCSNEKIDYAIQDLAGRVIKAGTINPTANTAIINLNIITLQAGSYIISLRQNGMSVKEKFVKTN